MLIGQTLDPYRVLATLGEGAMGEVYRARDTTLDSNAAHSDATTMGGTQVGVVLGTPANGSPQLVLRLDLFTRSTP